MKSFFIAALVVVLPALALAQAPAPAKKEPKIASTKQNATVKRSALKAVEEVTAIDMDPNLKLTLEDLEIAKRVFVGTIPCELGASVTITASIRQPGLFVVQTGKTRFRMHPVESRTGAIRLEDAKQGALWLQLGNKSMLMSQKLGQRLADECMSPEQLTLADELKKNPRPGLLDAAAVPAAPK